MRTRTALIFALGLAWGGLTAPVAAQTPDEVVTIIQQAATEYGANGAALVRLATCESTLNPRAVGDHGTSFGPFQINSLSTGLLSHFRAVGYSDPFDTEQAARYVARVSLGTWAAEGITLARWSCWGR